MGQRFGGRQKGTPNKAKLGVRDLLDRVLDDDANERAWRKWLKHKDSKIAFEAFKLAQAYKYGKPVQPVVDEDPAPPVQINISAIPMKRERVN